MKILITKNKDFIINFEIPPADHLTEKFIFNPVAADQLLQEFQTNISLSRVDNEDKVFESTPIYSSKWCIVLQTNSYTVLAAS
jgi:hypothetical protein